MANTFSYGAELAPTQQEYSYKLPQPPRIVVPPEMDRSISREIRLAHDVGTASLSDMTFLKDILVYDFHNAPEVWHDWRYEQRRRAQRILPWLYLGPLLAAKDRDFLVREGITMTLGIRTGLKNWAGAVTVGQEVCEEVESIEVSGPHTLVAAFPRATQMINAHMAKIQARNASMSNGNGLPRYGKVLVFCESGNERSAAVVTAYLMEMLQDFNHIAAMQICQSRRFCANLDDMAKVHLETYWEILQAKRTVAAAQTDTFQMLATSEIPSIQIQQVAGRQKRNRDPSLHDEEMDIDTSNQMDPSDALRFRGRDVTPFQD